MKKSILTLSGLVAFSLGANATSPFIARVYDYVPAPGQFVNTIPAIPADADEAEVCRLVEAQIVGNEDDGARPGMITLGAFGGYVTLGFDHPVVNVKGAYDFKIYGNSIVSDLSATGGAAEPGIVMVSQDSNGNGLPDDEWFELKGSEYGNQTATRGFEITYVRPSSDRPTGADPDPDNSWCNDRTYIPYSTNDPSDPEGYLRRVVYHSQSYWPEWIKAETLTFSGTRLPDNVSASSTASNWLLDFFDWGYVDNKPDFFQGQSNPDVPGFDIGNAVDNMGNPVELDQIDFIRVYSAMHQQCGWIGETSTEICGGEDLHPDAKVDTFLSFDSIRETDDNIQYYDLNGRSISPNDMMPGVYIRRSGKHTSKFIIL